MIGAAQRAGDLAMSGLTPHGAASSTARRLLRVTVAAIAVALTMIPLDSPFAAARNNPANTVLQIMASNNARELIPGLLPDITAVSGLETPPVIKYTSAMGALRDFCKGVGGSSPDIVVTTRRLRSGMASECTENGVEHMAQVALGRSALVLAVRTGSTLRKLTAREVYLALARDVPDQDGFRRNTAIQWSDIARSLPAQEIRFQIPPRENNARALFNALILEGGCRREPLVKLIFAADQRATRGLTTRVDRVREIPHDQAVQALLDAPEGTVGVLTYFDVMQTGGKLSSLAMDGVLPTDETILNGTYDFASLYWLYAKRGQASRARAPALDLATERIIAIALTEPVLGPGGAVSKVGLIPLAPADRAAQREVFAARPSAYGRIGSFVAWVADTASAARSLVGLAVGERRASHRTPKAARISAR